MDLILVVAMRCRTNKHIESESMAAAFVCCRQPNGELYDFSTRKIVHFQLGHSIHGWNIEMPSLFDAHECIVKF